MIKQNDKPTIIAANPRSKPSKKEQAAITFMSPYP